MMPWRSLAVRYSSARNARSGTIAQRCWLVAGDHVQVGLDSVAAPQAFQLMLLEDVEIGWPSSRRGSRFNGGQHLFFPTRFGRTVHCTAGEIIWQPRRTARFVFPL